MPETPTLVTTRQKVERLLKPTALQRMEQAGLMLIETDDFASLMQGVRGIQGRARRPARRESSSACASVSA